MFLEDYCSACGDQLTNSRVYHHISYDPEIVETVCKSCHGKIHSNISYCPELTPSLTREEAKEKGLIEFEDSDKNSVNPGTATISFKSGDEDAWMFMERMYKQGPFRNRSNVIVYALEKMEEEYDEDQPLT